MDISLVEAILYYRIHPSISLPFFTFPNWEKSLSRFTSVAWMLHPKALSMRLSRGGTGTWSLDMQRAPSEITGFLQVNIVFMVFSNLLSLPYWPPLHSWASLGLSSHRVHPMLYYWLQQGQKELLVKNLISELRSSLVLWNCRCSKKPKSGVAALSVVTELLISPLQLPRFSFKYKYNKSWIFKHPSFPDP